MGLKAVVLPQSKSRKSERSFCWRKAIALRFFRRRRAIAVLSYSLTLDREKE
jgi:hypothetical protein